MKKTIEYLGKKYSPTYEYELLDDDKYNWLRNEYYSKPSFEEVQKEFKCIEKGGTKNTNITNYYVRDLMDKTLNKNNRWCIEDVLNCKELLSYFWYRTKLNEKVFLPNEKPRRKLDTAFRIGGRTIASRPSNFPIKIVDKILEKYNTNNYWYDFSCGWGARLIGALKNKVNYFGTDPNYLLTEKLKQMTKDYKQTNNIDRGIIDIRCQGSEVFIPEWENKIGLAFSSPPYFDLEDYKIGNQSWKKGVSYKQWLENYLNPTVKNIYKYLKNDGYFCINIKNIDGYDLIQDLLNICKNNNFKFIDTLELEQCKKYSNKVKNNKNGGFIDINENIFIFKKENEIEEENQISFDTLLERMNNE